MRHSTYTLKNSKNKYLYVYLTRTKHRTWTEETGRSPLIGTTGFLLLLRHDSLDTALDEDLEVGGSHSESLLRQSGADCIRIFAICSHWP